MDEPALAVVVPAGFLTRNKAPACSTVEDTVPELSSHLTRSTVGAQALLSFAGAGKRPAQECAIPIGRVPVGTPCPTAPDSAQELPRMAISFQTVKRTSAVAPNSALRASALLSEARVAEVEEVEVMVEVEEDDDDDDDDEGVLPHEQGQLVCDYTGCGYACSAKSALKRHQRRHTGVRPYECDIDGCTYAATVGSNLKRHKERRHNVAPYSMARAAKIIRCKEPSCNYQCKKPSVMSTHERTHSGDTPYTCAIEGCSFVTKTSSNLRRHERAHSGEKNAICEFPGCTYACTRKSTLRRHQLTHTKKKKRKKSGDSCPLRPPECPPSALLPRSTVLGPAGALQTLPLPSTRSVPLKLRVRALQIRTEPMPPAG